MEGRYSAEENRSFLNHIFEYSDYKHTPQEIKDFCLAASFYNNSIVFQKNTAIFINDYTGHSLSEHEIDILKRVSKVFEQTYTRFLDLQKAEAQAREAKIEAALEKVRGKAMAMHNSNDLSVTASTVFTELRKLGINPFRCGVSLHTKESRKNLLYYSIPSAEGDTLSLAGSALLSGHPVLSAIYDCWLRGEDYFPVLKGESLINYYQTLKQVGFDVPVSPSGYEQYGYYLAFSEGVFYGWSEKPYTEDEIKILHRFKAIIDLTFRRYIELQNAEANAIEAVRRSALDRVRAEIASMRTTGDLERIIPLIWNELTTLDVPFVRCGIFIMDEQQEQIHTFLSSPDGNAIASFNTPFSSPGPIAAQLPYWRKKEIYKDHWDGAAFLEQAKKLMEQGAISSPEEYLTANRPTSLYLHFLPFLQGMLYVGSDNPLRDEQLGLVQTLADAFSTAYARYEDFNRLESAKGQIEKTLVDLKQTQAQLVQSEKMASLGELTAGIAHEIQNPLNFVNNFSEVNKELLAELTEEIEKGNFEEVKIIAKGITENEEKISHHGKRADGIVKGMLQHSRSSSGVKEPTDINALAEEYLRLAFHGLRARDKLFNANTKTDFDKTVGKINIIPQDIGRVILNMISNAFYAVSEKHKENGAGYQPAVNVITRKSVDKVLISVKDNGNGIPQKVLDKIFQPFFTTKPTGQGTGLGLSLSYDIVKAHGGELKVETKEGEGSEFIILLPV
ncbi:MAG TPA: ATP-binding protein [Cyclobacteriaceae bacterium]